MEQVQKESKNPIKAVGDLLKESWGIFAKSFWVLVGIMAVPVIYFGLFFFLGSLLAIAPGEAILIIIIPLAVILGLILIVVSAWAGLALIWAIREREKKVGVKDCFRESAHLLPSYIWIYVLHLVIVSGGFLLLGIPGIILSVWFAFGYYVLVVEGKKGMNALIRSRELISGYWWQAFGRLFVIFAITFAIGWLINFFIIGITLYFLALIFSVVYVFLLYENFKAVKKDEEFKTPSAGRKAKFILVGIMGFVFVAAMIATMIAIMLIIR